MEKDRKYEWAQPSIEQVMHAGQMIAGFYGRMGKIELEEEIVPDNLTDAEAEERLLALADSIIEGNVKSHTEVAKTIRSLGYKIGPMGSASTQIDVAAYHLAKAVYLNQSTFQ